MHLCIGMAMASNLTGTTAKAFPNCPITGLYCQRGRRTASGWGGSSNRRPLWSTGQRVEEELILTLVLFPRGGARAGPNGGRLENLLDHVRALLGDARNRVL